MPAGGGLALRAAGATARPQRRGLRGERSRPAGPCLHTQPAAASLQPPPREEQQEEEGPREAAGETTSHGAPPRAMLSGPGLGPEPAAADTGRCEGAASSRRALYSWRRGAAPPAPSNRCRSRAGCPPACGGGAAASLGPPTLAHPPPSDGGALPAPAPRTALLPAPAPAPESIGRSPGSFPAPAPPQRGWGAAPPTPFSLTRGVTAEGCGSPWPFTWPHPFSHCPRCAAGLGDAWLPTDPASRAGWLPRCPVPHRRCRCRLVPELGVRGRVVRMVRGRSAAGASRQVRSVSPSRRARGSATQRGRSRCCRGCTSHRITSPALHINFQKSSVSWAQVFFTTLCVCVCVCKRTFVIEQPLRALQDPSGGALGADGCQSPAAPAGVCSLQPQETFAHKGRCELVFLLDQGNSKLTEMSLLQPLSKSPKDATTIPAKRMQGFKFGGMFVHTCISFYLPKLLANSQHLSCGYLLLAGFLCGGEANRFPVPPALLCHAQHHAGTGTALFCLGHRAYGQGETSAPGWSSSSKRDWHS